MLPRTGKSGYLFVLLENNRTGIQTLRDKCTAIFFFPETILFVLKYAASICLTTSYITCTSSVSLIANKAKENAWSFSIASLTEQIQEAVAC